MTISQPRSTAGKWFLVIMVIVEVVISMTVATLLSHGFSKELAVSPILSLALLIYLACKTIQFMESWKRNVEIPNAEDALEKNKIYNCSGAFDWNASHLDGDYANSITGWICKINERYPKIGIYKTLFFKDRPPEKFRLCECLDYTKFDFVRLEKVSDEELAALQNTENQKKLFFQGEPLVTEKSEQKEVTA